MDVRVRPEEKGGGDAAATIATKTTSHRSQRRGFVAEPFGDLVKRFAFHEDRAKGLSFEKRGTLRAAESRGLVEGLFVRWTIKP